MLALNLSAVLRARQIEKPYTYLVANGFSTNAAHRLINNKNRELRLDHITRLCELLHCEPNDLLAYYPNTNNRLAASHPLLKLTPKEDDLTWQENLKTMPLDQLRDLAKNITNPPQPEL